MAIYELDRNEYSTEEEFQKEVLVRELIENLVNDVSISDFTTFAEILKSLPTSEIVGWLPEIPREQIPEDRFDYVIVSENNEWLSYGENETMNHIEQEMTLKREENEGELILIKAHKMIKTNF